MIAAALALALWTPMAAVADAAAPAPETAAPSAALEPRAIRDVLRRVADWQLAHPRKHDPRGWVQGAWYTGLVAFADIADDPRFAAEVRRIGRANAWELGPSTFHADDHAVGATWLHAYAQDGELEMLEGVRHRLDFILAHPPQTSLTWGTPNDFQRWSWCDALFMAPPVWTRLYSVTGDRRYLDRMTAEYEATRDFLYDRAEHLFFRDSKFFERREANGKKVFWARGNGWVIAGLARLLSYLPHDHPDRARFERLFVELATRIASLQPKDGLWRASLLDPGSFPNPEASGSGFFTYALAWGINEGLLDRARVLPVVTKAWRQLVAAVDPDGKVGWVQPIGEDPKLVTRDMTEMYGAGAVLLAGSELHALLARRSDAVAVAVTNPIDVFRPRETIEVPIAALHGLAAGDVMVIDGRSGAVLRTQPVDADGNGAPEVLLVQVDLGARERRRLYVQRRRDDLAPARDAGEATGRLVPERKDDFAWENDRVAYRVYGPALERDGEISSGIDVWSKRTRALVLDRWYARDDYHADHGEGGDFYKVGPSRGCGGTALVRDGALAVSRNFVQARRFANGPIRVAFDLTYAPYDAGGAAVTETKRISLDAGTPATRVETRWSAALPAGVRPAAGIVLRGSGGELASDRDAGWLTYVEPATADGRIGCAVIVPGAAVATLERDGNALLVADRAANDRRGFVTYTASAWDRGSGLSSPHAFRALVADLARRAAAPVAVRIERPVARRAAHASVADR